MANKLTNVTKYTPKSKLTDRRNARFNILIGEELKTNYNFDNIQQKQSHALCQFFKKTIGKEWKDVDEKYKRPNDKSDKEDGYQIIHYKVNKKIRIHGYIENGIFVMTKFDPNHKVHK